MDTLTHVVLGAAVGEALMGKQIGKKAMLFGAVAANSPDIDAMVSFFVSDIDSLVMHRGITHSLFTAFIAGPLIGWGLWKVFKEKGLVLSWMMLWTLNILLHDFLDTCTVYGTGLLTPFSEYRYSFDNIFVADPLYTLPLVISVSALLILRNNHHSRHKWNRFGLAVSSVYMLFTFYNHFNATEALNAAMKEKGVKVNAYFAAPTLFNNLLWNVVAQDSAGFWVGYYSVFDGSNVPELNFVPKNDELLGNWSENEDIRKLKSFSKGFYCITESEGKRWFNDLRFGQVGGWENPKATFAFAFDLSENADNTMVVQKGRIDGSTKYMINSMWTRIKGR